MEKPSPSLGTGRLFKSSCVGFSRRSAKIRVIRTPFIGSTAASLALVPVAGVIFGSLALSLGTSFLLASAVNGFPSGFFTSVAGVSSEAGALGFSSFFFSAVVGAALDSVNFGFSSAFFGATVVSFWVQVLSVYPQTSSALLWVLSWVGDHLVSPLAFSAQQLLALQG